MPKFPAFSLERLKGIMGDLGNIIFPLPFVRNSSAKMTGLEILVDFLCSNQNLPDSLLGRRNWYDQYDTDNRSCNSSHHIYPNAERKRPADIDQERSGSFTIGIINRPNGSLNLEGYIILGSIVSKITSCGNKS